MSHSKKNDSQIEVDREDPALHFQLCSIFSKVISEKLSTMLKASQEDPVESAAATSETISRVPTREDLAAPRKSPYKGKNHIVGQFVDVIFEVPEDCLAAKIDMDKIAEINPNCRSSFAERLKGWYIECRQRLKNKIGPRNDWSFRHSNSRKEFRSVVEVVDYIIYEIYPKWRDQHHRLMTLDNGVNLNEVLTSNPNGASSSVCDARVKALRDKEIVENFLSESWLNLMNSGGTERYNMQERHEVYWYANAGVAEEMIDTLYYERQESDEEFSDTVTYNDDQSFEKKKKTDEEMIEAVHNDMKDKEGWKRSISRK